MQLKLYRRGISRTQLRGFLSTISLTPGANEAPEMFDLFNAPGSHQYIERNSNVATRIRENRWGEIEFPVLPLCVGPGSPSVSQGRRRGLLQEKKRNRVSVRWGCHTWARCIGGSRKSVTRLLASSRSHRPFHFVRVRRQRRCTIRSMVW